MERLDLGPCWALRRDGTADGVAVLLPGHSYPTRAPALWFAREAAMARGWGALEVLGEPSEHEDPLAWEEECAERAIETAATAPMETGGTTRVLEDAGTARVLVIGKSMASLLAGAVADRDLPAVWLTPLLNEPSVIEGLARARRPTLLVGGSADPTWRPDALPGHHSFEMLELPGGDHTLQVPGDPVASLAGLGQMTEAIMRFADPADIRSTSAF